MLIDGQAVKSCTMLAVQADGAEITTIEGLMKNGELHPMQEGFWERHGQSIDSRSTIIVTGDARSNHREPRLEILSAIHARARKVYLLNPEPESDWNTTDSIVDAYLPGFDGVFEVRNLRQLGEAVYRIT